MAEQPGAEQPGLSRREALLQTALEMFDRAGFRATGIDRVLAEAGVAKMTLYNHFGSKDGLILEVLRRRSAEFRDWFRQSVEKRAATPRARLGACFEVLDGWIRGRDFRGCMFVAAAAEFGRPDDPAHRAAAEHKRQGRDYLRDLAAAAGAADPDALADGLALLTEGAIAAAHVMGDRDAARKAGRAAEVLIADALGPGRGA